jgi:hypothetical protein
LYKFPLIFKVWKQIRYLNQFKKDLNPHHSVGLELVRGLVLFSRPKAEMACVAHADRRGRARVRAVIARSAHVAADADPGDEVLQLRW